MLKERMPVIRKAMLLGDASIVSLAFFLSFILRQHFYRFYKFDLFPSSQVLANPPGSISDYLVVLFLVVPIWCIMLYSNGMYHNWRTRSLFKIVWIILKSSFFSAFAFGTVIFLFKMRFMSRLFFAIFIVLSLTLIVLEKIVIFFFMRYIRKKGHNFKRLLVVGTGRRAVSFIRQIHSHAEWGLRILGVIDDEPYRDIEKVGNVGVIGILKNLPEILHLYAIDEVVFVVPRSRLNHMENAINACEIEGVKATIAVDLFDLKIAKSYQTKLGGIPLLTFETTVTKEWQLFIKRAMDIVTSVLAIIVLSPVLLIAAILIKLTSSGPVMFKQKRVSLNGRKFVLCKFRTMYKGAHKKQEELKAQNEMEGPVFKIKKDPRITPLGRILRKFSIDELPQLFNVFVGHMSLIGPRPLPTYEVEEFEPWQRRRLSMRPGISCSWQVNGRNKINFEEWMKLDLEYIDNWSLWLDFKIMMKTIPVVLFGIGAY